MEGPGIPDYGSPDICPACISLQGGETERCDVCGHRYLPYVEDCGCSPCHLNLSFP
jgi:hypothetical protein